MQREIVVRTPENIELRFALAGPGSRAAAYFIDLVLMSIISQILSNLIVFIITTTMKGLSTASEVWAGAIAGIILFALYNGYFIGFEWLMNGQTPGKRLLHVRVIKEGGYGLRLFDTLLRNLLRVIDFVPLFYGIGLVSLLLTRNCQRLGDLVAGTLVVHQDPVATEALLDELPTGAEAEPLPAGQVAAIPGEVITLASEFWTRRGELAPRARQELGAELVELVRRGSGLSPQPAQSVENFLAGVIRSAEQIAPSSYRIPSQG